MSLTTVTGITSIDAVIPRHRRVSLWIQIKAKRAVALQEHRTCLLLEKKNLDELASTSNARVEILWWCIQARINHFSNCKFLSFIRTKLPNISFLQFWTRGWLEWNLSLARRLTYKVSHSAKAGGSKNYTFIRLNNVHLEPSLAAQGACTRRTMASKEALLRRHGNVDWRIWQPQRLWNCVGQKLDDTSVSAKIETWYSTSPRPDELNHDALKVAGKRKWVLPWRQFLWKDFLTLVGLVVCSVIRIKVEAVQQPICAHWNFCSITRTLTEHPVDRAKVTHWQSVISSYTRWSSMEHIIMELLLKLETNLNDFFEELDSTGKYTGLKRRVC